MKKCIRCGEVKPSESFHKHPKMRDGRLNKCAVCVKACVDEWRAKNPDCRKQEHARKQAKKPPRHCIGRKASLKKYMHKRYSRTKVTDELTDFVMEEASKLCEMREAVTGFKWHIDHIVPLNYKLASGLHTAANLQVVPASWNLKKRHLNMDSYWNE